MLGSKYTLTRRGSLLKYENTVNRKKVLALSPQKQKLVSPLCPRLSQQPHPHWRLHSARNQKYIHHHYSFLADSKMLGELKSGRTLPSLPPFRYSNTVIINYLYYLDNSYKMHQDYSMFSHSNRFTSVLTGQSQYGDRFSRPFEMNTSAQHKQFHEMKSEMPSDVLELFKAN